MEISIIKTLPLKYARLWMPFWRLVSKNHVNRIPSSIFPHKPLFESQFSWLQESRKFHMLKHEESTILPYDTLRKTIRNHFDGFEEGNTCFTVDCPGCTERSNRSIGKLTINSVTGFSFCTQCFLQGNWTSMDAYLKELERSDHSVTSNNQPKIDDFLSMEPMKPFEANQMIQVWNAAEAVGNIPKNMVFEVLEKLNLQGVEIKTLEKLGAKINPQLHQIVIPCKTSPGIDFHSLKILAPKTLIDKETGTEDELLFEEITLPALQPWLLGYDLTQSKDEIVLTSSAADTLISLQNLPVPALCLPSGISQLPLVTLALLDRFRKITLWLDHGLRGQESARAFAKKLGEKRCHYIRSSKDTPSAYRCHLEGKNALEVFRTAYPVVHKSVTTFSRLRNEVYQEIIQSKDVAGVRWRRFPILTELLKGHRRGELTIFTGPTGAGKTTFLSDYSLDLCTQGVRTLWGSFEICNVRLAKRMLHQFSGVDLDKEPHKFEAIADDFEKLFMFFLAFHGQQNVADVLDAMSHAVYVHDISHIIIDNLQFMMGSDTNSLDRFYMQDKIIGSFRQFATVNNVHITMVIHPRKEVDELTTSSIFGGAKASQEADNILILQDKRSTDSTNRRKYLQVVKNRYTGDLGVMPLEFHKESLSFAPPKSKAKLPIKKTPTS